MRKRLVMFGGALAVVVVVTTLLASNMGVKTVYHLRAPAPGVSATGFNALALPYFHESSIVDAEDLMDDIGPAAKGVTKFLPSTDGISYYTRAPADPPPFTIVPGEMYLVKVDEDVDYRIVGSHDPGLVITFLGPENSASGLTPFAPPHNTTVQDAKALLDAIGSTAVDIRRYRPENDSWTVYCDPYRNTCR